MAVTTRFAPSPSGRLHRGHALSALAGHELARRGGGRFLLRIEDIDAGRARAAHVEALVEDLRWLGMAWETPVRVQSQHMDDYAAALTRLDAQGLLYRCFCTRRDIAEATRAPHGPEGAVYPGTCRILDPQQAAERAQAAPFALRLRMDAAVRQAGPLFWRDVIAGPQPADPAAFGDVVLARKDVAASYHLAVTVDDALQGVTDVVRGDDLFAASHVHRLLQALLELPTPLYRHHPLLRDAAGKRLAKRDGAETLAALRAAGADPRTLARDLLAQLPDSFWG